MSAKICGILFLEVQNMSTELIDLSNALARETDRAAASVVAIHTEARGSSSGVVWRAGIIVTAEHALRRDEEIKSLYRMAASCVLRLQAVIRPRTWPF